MAKFLVCWDFVQRPKTTFYSVYAAEFARGEVELVQRSVAVCASEFTARRLRALAEYYGANVLAYKLNGLLLDDPAADANAQTYIARVHEKRLHARGRKPTRLKANKRK